MPGSALFPDEPAPQTAAKKFPEGRSPPGPEKKKHTSAAAPAKKLESAGPGFRMFSQTSGRHLLFFRRWCWALSQRGTPLCRVRRERLSRPDLPHPAEEGDSSPPSPVSHPRRRNGGLLLDLAEASADANASIRPRVCAANSFGLPGAVPAMPRSPTHAPPKNDTFGCLFLAQAPCGCRPLRRGRPLALLALCVVGTYGSPTHAPSLLSIPLGWE